MNIFQRAAYRVMIALSYLTPRGSDCRDSASFMRAALRYDKKGWK